MKQIIISVALFTLVGCKRTTKQQNRPAPIATTPVLVVHINDYSESTDGISYFSKHNAESLYYAIGQGCIKHIAVLEDSHKQDVLSLSVTSPDTVSLVGDANVYRIGKKKAANAKVLEIHYANASRDIERYSTEVSKPHNQQRSDLASSLALAKTCIEQGNYTDHQKVLLISSDMLHNPRRKSEGLQPIELSNTRVMVIRPAVSLDSLKVLFPSSDVSVFTSAADAISFIKQVKNN